jgi:hypothetical protein
LLQSDSLMADFLSQLTESLLPRGRRGKALDRRRTMALCLLRNPVVQWSEGEYADSSITLIIPLQRRQTSKTVEWLASKIARQQPPTHRKVALDPIGSYIWRAGDGTINVRQLIWSLADRFKLNRRDAESALLEFLSQLSARQLMGFVPPQRQENERG